MSYTFMNIFTPTLITTITLFLNIILIIFLVQRTLISGLEDSRAQRLRRLLNIALVPLLVVFALTMVWMLSSGQATSFAVAPRNAPKTGPVERPIPTVVVGGLIADVEDLQVTPTPSPIGTDTPQVAVIEATAIPPETISSTATAAPSRTDSVVAQAATPAIPSAAEPLPTQTSTASPNQFTADLFNTPESGWLVHDAGTWSADYSDGVYRLTLKGQADLTVSQPLSEQNYQLSVDVRATQGAPGLVFLSTAPSSFYCLMIKDGTFAVQVHEQHRNHISTVIDWTPNTAIYPIRGLTNHLRIERHGNEMRFFANDALLSTWMIPEGVFNNQHGFALVGENGQGQAQFDNLVGVRLPMEEQP